MHTLSKHVMEIITESQKYMVRQYGTFIARIFIGLLFLVNGISKVAGFKGAVSYIASTGAPMPELLNIIAIIVEIGGGLLIVVGYATAEAAAALIVFTIGTLYLFHAPTMWFGKTDQASVINQTMFLKNLGLIGGLLYIVGYGPGAGFSFGKRHELPEEADQEKTA